MEQLFEVVFSVRSVPKLYNEDQLPLWESLETAIRRVEGWREMATSLLGREPVSRGTSIVGRRYQAEQ
jgi:myo-inositol catabolism protein IolC